jgi:uncharacterized damage-inducible protein DinB
MYGYDLFAYNKWANLELFDACRRLTEGQLDLRLPGASGSVRELLVHLAGGQQTQILRTKGRQHEGELTRESEWPGLETLIDLIDSTSDELIAIANEMSRDVDVDLPYYGKTYRFPRSFFLLHALTHGIEHRTEIKVTLNHFGIETPDLDGWNYAAAAGYGEEVTPVGGERLNEDV